MAHKILVADDSLTVQKVVSITLASYDYELIECKDDSQLNEELIKGGASLVLLDLNLSENKTGYEISSEIHTKNPELPIILLLGTFDTAEEKLFQPSGIVDHIVKPFESNVFISKIQSVLESSDTFESSNEDDTTFLNETESDFINTESEDELSLDNNSQESGEDWVVDSPSPVDKSSETWDSFSQKNEKENEDILKSSLEGWGMNVPASIDAEASEDGIILPSVIEEQESSETSSPKSKLISVEEFKIEEEEESLSLDEPSVEIEAAVSELSEEIEDEEDADDFWAIDDTEPTKNTFEEEADEDVEKALLEEKALLKEKDSDDGFKIEPEDEFVISIDEQEELEPLTLMESPSVKSSSPKTSALETEFDKDKLVAQIIEELKPVIEKIIETQCKETIENVAWQIIPDLAENLIRSEIKEIKDNSL